MSIFVMAPVLRATLPDLAGIAERKGCTAQTLKLVALSLADSANDDGTGARPGVRTIAGFAQLHSATVCRALALLVELEAIKLTEPGGPGRCATYTVNVGWFYARIDLPRHRRSCPPLRAPGAQGEARAPEAREARAPGAQGACPPQAREARAPEAREARAPEARSYVLTSVTSPDASDDEMPPWVAARWGYLMGDHGGRADCATPALSTHPRSEQGSDAP